MYLFIPEQDIVGMTGEFISDVPQLVQFAYVNVGVRDRVNLKPATRTGKTDCL